MARINLLPWREERRKERQQEILAVMGLAAILGIGIVFAVHSYIDSKISFQKERNALLQKEITRVNSQIREIKDLDSTKADLLARMGIIQELQSSRPEVVHIFDELAQTVPEGVYLTKMIVNEEDLQIEGLAQSNARVSAYMHNLNASQWLTDPKLGGIVTKGKDKDRVSSFKLSVERVQRSQEDKTADGEKP